MSTSVKLMAIMVALSVASPCALALTPEQATANLKGAIEFEHIAHKTYSAAIRAEYAASIDADNANNTPNEKAMTDAHIAARNRLAEARQDKKFAEQQLQAARLAFKDGSIAPVATPHPQPLQPINAPQKIPSATPGATPQPMNAPVAVTQSVPQKTPVMTAQLTSQPMNTPVAVTQSVPQKTPVMTAQLTPQPMNTPVAVTQSVPQKTPVMPAQLTPQPMNTPVAVTQSVPQKTPVMTAQLTPQPMNTPVAVTPSVPQKTPVMTAQLTPQPMNTPVAVTPSVPQKTPVMTAQLTPQPKTVPAAVAQTTSTQPSGQKINGATYNVTSNNQVNNAYIDQINSRQMFNTNQRIDSNSQRINSNSKAISRNAKDIDETKHELKRGLNNAAAMSSLHYHSDNSWALSTGTANGDGAALAGGLQKGVTEHVAVNVQASSSFDSGWMAGAGITGDF